MNIINIIIKTVSVIALATVCSFSFAATNVELSYEEEVAVLEGLKANNYLDSYQSERSALFDKGIMNVKNGVTYMTFKDSKDNDRLISIDAEFEAKYNAMVEKVKAKR